MQREGIDLNKYIVEKQPKTGGPSSLLFYKIEAIDFTTIKKNIHENRLTERKIREKTTANGFTGEIISKNEKIRLGFARSGNRKLSFLNQERVIPLRLQIIPHHVELQFEKSEESAIELVVQGGNKEFLNNHFLKTLRNIVKEHEGILNRLNFSQKFMRKGLSIHKEDIYYLKVPPAQFKQHLKPIFKGKEFEYQEKTGEIRGKGILYETNGLNQIQQTPELRIIQYKGMIKSPFTGNKTKYSVKANGEMQFYLSQEEVKKAETSFKASLKLMQSLKSQVERTKVKKLPRGYLPDKKFSITLLKNSLENERYEQLHDILLDLETLYLFDQIEGEDKENIFKYFTDFLKKANMEALTKHMADFLPLIDGAFLKNCRKFRNKFHDFALEKLMNICKIGFVLYPCLKPVLSKRKKELEDFSSYQEYFKGFTLQQLTKLVKDFSLEKIYKTKENMQHTLNNQLKKALDLKKRYISKESQKKALRKFAITFFDNFRGISTTKTALNNEVLLKPRNGDTIPRKSVRCRIINEEVTLKEVSSFANAMESNKEKRGFIFTLSEFSETSKEKRKELLRDQRKLIYLVGKKTIERMLKKVVFSFASLRYYERKMTTQRPFHYIS